VAGTPSPAAAACHRHREVGERFGRVVSGVRDWSVPTPVPEWTAVDVLRHLLDWLPGLLAAAADVRLAPVADPALDPVGSWRERHAQVQALLEDPERAGRHVDRPFWTGRLDGLVDGFWTGDVFLHTWDLARATGQDDRLDEATCAEMLAGMEPIEELMRSSGQYGPRVPVPEDASVQDRLLGFIGRDPSWQPPRSAGGAKGTP
jgi:uncharacterized protein (TIGR03086 family)